MDLVKMITELQNEKQRLEEAIQALEKLSATKNRHRRGRPPRWAKVNPNASVPESPETAQEAEPSAEHQEDGVKSR